MNSILITGCNRGLGLGLVKSLSSSGTNRPKTLIATCRNPSEAHELQKIAAQNSDILHVIQFDLTDFNSYDRLVNEVSTILGNDGLNVLFNNAGVATKSTRISFVKHEDLLSTFQTNTVAPIMMAKSFYPLLKKASEQNNSSPIGSTRAAVINMSSILGSIASNTEGGMYAYRTSKSALNSATKSMAIDFKDHSILAVAMHPGWVQTDMGGSKAPLDVDTSCSNMVETILKLDESKNGLLVQYDGKTLPW